MTRYKLVRIIANSENGMGGLRDRNNFTVSAIGCFDRGVKLWTGEYFLRPGEKLAVIKPIHESNRVVEE